MIAASVCDVGVEAEKRVHGLHRGAIGALTLKAFGLSEFGLSENVQGAVQFPHEEGRVPAASASYPMELVVRSSAGLLERMPMGRSLDISGMERLLLLRIEGGMDGRQEVEIFSVGAAADVPQPFSQRS